MKLFSVEEANALVPELKRLWAAVRTARGTLKRLEADAKSAAEHATEGGGMREGCRYAAALTAILEQVQAVMSLGVEVKDIERGLCDFPHWREDRVVYLCWQYGEDRIEWWHDVEAGFAGRQPL